MSWSFSVFGKPAAVAKAVRDEKARNACVMPEEGLRQAALELIATTADTYPEDKVLKASGCGHQSSGNAEKAVNQYEIKVEPIHGFVE